MLLVIAVPTVILYVLGVFDFFNDEERLKAFLKSLGPLSFVGFILLQSAQVVAAPIPGELTGFLGGYLYGPGLGILLSTVGLTIGSWLAFTLAKIFGRPLVDKLVSKKSMEKYDYLLHHKGAFLAFLLFLIPGFPKDILCYILGLGHLTTREFLVISTLGRLSGTILLTLGGDFLRHRQYGMLSLLCAIAVLIVFFSLLYKDKLEHLFRKLHEHSKKHT